MLLTKPKGFFGQKKASKNKGEMPLHLKRVRAEMVSTSPDAIIPVQILLNETDEKIIVIQSSRAVVPGKVVTLKLQDPAAVQIKAKVTWYQEARRNPRVLMDVNYLYRMGLEFVPADDEQKKALEKLIEEIRLYHVPFISFVD